MNTLLQSASMPLLAFALQATIVAGLALVVARLLSKRGAAFRIAVYRAAILSILALLVAGPLVRLVINPAIELGASSQVTLAAPDPVNASPERATAHKEAAPSSEPRLEVAGKVATVATPAKSYSFDEAFTMTYAGGVVLLLLSILAGSTWLLRLRLRSKPHVGVTKAVLSPGIKTAFAAGAIWPTIYLPSDTDERYSADVVDAILRHEAIHVARGDTLWALLARLLCAVAWISPLPWILAHRLRQDSEELCDRLVLQSGIEPAAYAASLLRIAESFVSSPAEHYLGVGVVTAKSQLSKRISVMLDSNSNSATIVAKANRLKIASAFLLMLVGAALIVSAAPLIRVRHDKTPEETVKAFFVAWNKMDWEGAFSRIEGVKTDVVVPQIQKIMAPLPGVKRYGIQPIARLAEITKVSIQGDTASVSFRLPLRFPPNVKLPQPKPMEDVATLHRVDGDWKIVSGKAEHGYLAQATEVGRDPSKLEMARKAVRKTWLLSNLKQIGIAAFMYAAAHDDKFPTSQAKLKEVLKPYIKADDAWLDTDGTPMDVRINPAILGKSGADIPQPANCVLLSLGPRGRLLSVYGSTPIGFCDGHVKMVRLDQAGKLSWK